MIEPTPSTALAGVAHSMHREYVVGNINANEHNAHGLALSRRLMRVRTSHRGISMPVAAMQSFRDGKVGFLC